MRPVATAVLLALSCAAGLPSSSGADVPAGADASAEEIEALSSVRLRALAGDGAHVPAAGAQAPAFDPNARVNSNPAGAQNEVSMDSDSAGNLYAGWNDASGGSYRCGFGRSTDGGRTWEQTEYYLGPRQEAGDAVVRAHGPVIWRLCMSFTRAPSLEADIMISKSIDGGKSFGQWIRASVEGGTNDKPWFDFDGDHLYIAVYDLGPIAFWKSDDGGSTWSRKKNIGSGQGNCIMAGENGTVVVGWGLSSRIVRSTDWGETFGTVKNAFVTGTGGSNPRSAPLLTCSAHPNRQDMYFSWAQKFAGEESVFAMHSGDGGATWDGPARVAPGSNRQIMPGIDVTVDGTVHVGWTEFVSGKVRAFYSNSTDRGANWTVPVGISDGAGDVDIQFMGDYNALDASRQNRVGYAWCDTREGGADIYFGGFWHGQPGGGGNVSRIQVTPAVADITVDQTQRFSAIAYDAANNVVSANFSWSATSGTMSSDGVYHPHRSGNFTVFADAFGRSGSAKVNVDHGAPISLGVSPSAAAINADQTLRFTALERDSKGNTWQPAGLAWSVTGGGSGTIDPTGLYVPAATGTFEVVGHSRSSGLRGTANVTVAPGKLTAVLVVPPLARITSDERLQFDAIAEDAKGNEIQTSFTWTVEDGRINETGFFSPQRTGSWLVRATAREGMAGDATVEVTLGALVSLRIEPATAAITADENASFAAFGTDVHGNEERVAGEWSADRGDVSANGTYAPGPTGRWSVYVKAGGLATVAKVTVTPGRLASVSVEPESVTFDKGQSGPFQAKPRDSKGNLLTAFTTLWELAGDPVGDLDRASGSFTARSAGEGVVKATVTAGGIAMGAEAKVNVRGGLFDLKGGGQLLTVLAALAALLAGALGPGALLWRRRRKEAEGPASHEPGPREIASERAEAPDDGRRGPRDRDGKTAAARIARKRGAGNRDAPRRRPRRPAEWVRASYPGPSASAGIRRPSAENVGLSRQGRNG